MLLVLAYSALPSACFPLMATNPCKLRDLRAALMHSAHALAPEAWYLFFAAADAFFETIFPYLLRISLSLVRPVVVFSLLPRSTCDRARLPRAILLVLVAHQLVLGQARGRLLLAAAQHLRPRALAPGDLAHALGLHAPRRRRGLLHRERHCLLPRALARGWGARAVLARA